MDPFQESLCRGKSTDDDDNAEAANHLVLKFRSLWRAKIDSIVRAAAKLTVSKRVNAISDLAI